MLRLPARASVAAFAALIASAAAPVVASADVPYRDFVFDGSISAIAASADGVFVAGAFTREQAARPAAR
jgi:hypothetical protein